MFPIIIKNKQNEFIPLITMPQPWTVHQFEKIEKVDKSQLRPLSYKLTNNSQQGFEYFKKAYMKEPPVVGNFDLDKCRKRFLELEPSLCPSYKTYYAQLYLYYWYFQPDFAKRKEIINAVLDMVEDELEEKLKAVYLDISFAVPTSALSDFVVNNYRGLLLNIFSKSVSFSHLNIGLYEQIFGSDIVEKLLAQGLEKLKLISENGSLIRDTSQGEVVFKTLTGFSTRSISELQQFFRRTDTKATQYAGIVRKLFVKETAIIDIYPDVPFGEFGQFHFEILDKLANGPAQDSGFEDFYKSMEQERAKRRSVVILDAFRRSLAGRKTLKFKGDTHNQNNAAIGTMLKSLEGENSNPKEAANKYLQKEEYQCLIKTILADQNSEVAVVKESSDASVEAQRAAGLRQLLSVANKELAELFEQPSEPKKLKRKPKSKAGRRNKGKNKHKPKPKQKAASSPKIKLDGAGISSFSIELFFSYAKKRLKDELHEFSALLRQSPPAVACDRPQPDFAEQCTALESKISECQKRKSLSLKSLTALNNQVEDLVKKIINATAKLEAPLQEARQSDVNISKLDKFCRDVLQHFKEASLVEAQNCGGRIPIELPLSRETDIRSFFHNRIFEFSDEAFIGTKSRKLSFSEKFAFYVTRKSNTDEIWFCISLHRWVLKDPDDWDAISNASDFIDPEHWKDTDRWLGNSYYVLHIPHPDS